MSLHVREDPPTPPLARIHLGFNIHVVFVFVFEHSLSGTAYKKYSFDIFSHKLTKK